jgi:hypothetical protein
MFCVLNVPHPTRVNEQGPSSDAHPSCPVLLLSFCSSFWFANPPGSEPSCLLCPLPATLASWGLHGAGSWLPSGLCCVSFRCPGLCMQSPYLVFFSYTGLTRANVSTLPGVCARGPGYAPLGFYVISQGPEYRVGPQKGNRRSRRAQKSRPQTSKGLARKPALRPCVPEELTGC